VWRRPVSETADTLDPWGDRDPQLASSEEVPGAGNPGPPAGSELVGIVLAIPMIEPPAP
jgi:hypothetical protein